LALAAIVAAGLAVIAEFVAALRSGSRVDAIFVLRLRLPRISAAYAPLRMTQGRPSTALAAQ